MPAAQLVIPAQDRSEAKALVVAISALQLALVVLVWLLALAPAAMVGLGVMTVKAARAFLRPSIPTANAP